MDVPKLPITTADLSYSLGSSDACSTLKKREAGGSLRRSVRRRAVVVRHLDIENVLHTGLCLHTLSETEDT